MTNLVPVASFDDVYQLETTDIALAGTSPSQVMNRQGQSLLNRTTYLDVNKAAKGANSDITSLTGLTTNLSEALGGNSYNNMIALGGNPDGVTSSTAAVAAAEASSRKVITVNDGVFLTTATAASLNKCYVGNGQIKTTEGKRGKFFSAVKTAPSSFGAEGSIDTAFNGDWAHSNFAIEHRVTGTATLGQPVTGYTYTQEAMANYTYMLNSSGWNQTTTSNVGRTGIAAYRAKVDQYGQGDAVCFNGSVFVTGTKAGSTHFLANPAGVLFNGDMTAGAAGVYLNPYETACSDGGFDIACVGIVNNFNRTISTGAKSCFWGGYRAQSTGSASLDSIISANGKWLVGVDLALGDLDLGANQAAVSLKTGQRIYLNNTSAASGNLGANWRTTAFNNDYISHNGTNIAITAGGNQSLQIGTTQLTITTTAGLSLASTGILRFDGTGQFLTGTSTAIFTATNKPGATTGSGPTQWLFVRLAGNAFYIPAWPA